MRTTYNGGVQGTFTNLPFGDGLTTAYGTDGDPYHLAGFDDHDYEPDTEHAQFREYSSKLGRWLSPDPYSGSYDPSSPQSFNRYAYVLNNPVAQVDPSGLNITAGGGYYGCGNNPTCSNTNGGAGGGGIGGIGDPYGSCCGMLGNGFGGGTVWDEFGVLNFVSATPGGIEIVTITILGMDDSSTNYTSGNIAWLLTLNLLPASFRAGGVEAPNNGECDNACQLAHAFNKTGVYSLTSVCFVPGFYAASAAGATGAVAVANAPEVYAATAGDYATWYGRAVSWLSRMVGKTPTGAGTALAAAPGALSQFCSSH